MAVSTNFTTLQMLGAQTTNLVNQARQQPNNPAAIEAVGNSYQAYFAELLRANASLQQQFSGIAGQEPTPPQPPTPPPFNPNPFGLPTDDHGHPVPAEAAGAPVPAAPPAAAPTPVDPPVPPRASEAPVLAAPPSTVATAPAPAAPKSSIATPVAVTDDHGRIVGFK